jgi:excisionase family DNA binding protein
MVPLHPGITGRADLHLEPLAVSPRQACVLLNVGNTKLYQLLGSGELESYLDGGARRIPMDSIRRRITMLLASASATGAATEYTPQSRRPNQKAEHDGWSGRRRPGAKTQEDKPGAAE